VSTPEEAEIQGDPPPDAPPAPAARDEVGPVAHAAFWFAIGCALIAVAQLPLALGRPPAADAWGAEPTSSTSAVATSSGTLPANLPFAPDGGLAPALAQVALVDDDAPPAAIRVGQLDGDPTLEVVSAKIGKRSCDAALLALGVTKRDMLRIDAAMKRPPVSRKLNPCHATDRIFVAFSKEGRRVRAFELETAPGDFVLVREPGLVSPAWAALAASQADADAGAPTTADAGTGADTEMIAQHSTLPQTHKRHAVAFTITTDLAAAIAAAGLDPSVLDLLDDALSSRADLPTPRVGTVFRIVADATYVLGRFDRYDELVAIEVRPQPESPPIRLKHLRDSKMAGGHHDWFDAKAKQPLRGKWRMPLTFARVTSRFNPKRLHPVLHTIQPHNGCDFAASMGTPVYSIAAGVIAFEGNAGPSGNLVTILHEGGYESGYAHLSRFVPGVVPGTHVEAHTLIGYSGSTGRSTGPHLHLSVKRAGVFIDPLTLKLDGVRVVPPAERNAFTARKADADAALDSIPLPPLGTVASPVSSAAPQPSSSAAPDEEPADEH
jgi:murein DD-endopeptidase MepM/ murein hydrolase activator NlpD